MLAGDRIEFLQFQLVGLAAWILLGYVIETGVSAADELDEHGIRFCHCRGLAQGFRVPEDNAGLAPVKAAPIVGAAVATGTAARFGPGVTACTACA